MSAGRGLTDDLGHVRRPLAHDAGVARDERELIQVEFDSIQEAIAARERLLSSGVLDRFSDRTGPTVVEEAEAVRRWAIAR